MAALSNLSTKDWLVIALVPGVADRRKQDTIDRQNPVWGRIWTDVVHARNVLYTSVALAAIATGVRVLLNSIAAPLSCMLVVYAANNLCKKVYFAMSSARLARTLLDSP